jgi:hypothetical protein
MSYGFTTFLTYYEDSIFLVWLFVALKIPRGMSLILGNLAHNDTILRSSKGGYIGKLAGSIMIIDICSRDRAQLSLSSSPAQILDILILQHYHNGSYELKALIFQPPRLEPNITIYVDLPLLPRTHLLLNSAADDFPLHRLTGLLA